VPLYQARTSVLGYPVGLRVVGASSQTSVQNERRLFSTTRPAQLKDFFPAKETNYIRQTLPAWPHHGFSEAELHGVVTTHRATRTIGDWLAWKFVRVAR
jgi:hypothetical protein